MFIATMQPSLSQLQNFAAKVRTYPVSVRQLLDFADQKGEPKTVVNFFRSFPQDQVFDDKEDLASRTEQVKIMRQEEQKMPPEQQVAPEEY